MINRRDFIAGAGALAASGILIRQLAAAKEISGKADNAARPNLLFIMPDQFRLQALGIWSQPGHTNSLNTVSDPVHTPGLNRLAAQSVLFTQACATAPLCSPSRAMLMSGMYPSRNGVVDNCKEGNQQSLHDDIPCFTDVLSDAGYETAYVGKTHWERDQPLFDMQGNYVGTVNPPGGNYANPYDTYIPPGRGRHSNNYWFQDIKDQHFDALSYSSVPALVGGKKDGQVYRYKEFTPELEADIVINYLKNTSGQRDPNKSFSVMWCPNPPHTPYDSLKDCEEEVYREYYKDMPMDKMLNRPNVDAAKTVSAGLSDPRQCAPIYFSLVTSIDQQVDRVLRALEETGVADNTIVVFTSDHGEMMGSHGRMAKSVIYDEAFLVPFMIRFPKKLKPRVENLLLGRVDVMPTLLGMMGLKSRIPDSVRGVDYSTTLLTGRTPEETKPKSAVYLLGEQRGVRSGRYTYQVDSEGRTELYDNTADPYQMKNLALDAIHPADLRLLQEELGRWLKTADDPWYQANSHKELIVYPGNS